MVGTKNYKNQEHHFYHRNLSSVAPFDTAKKAPHWSRAVHAFFFSVIHLQRGRGVMERGGNGSENFSALLHFLDHFECHWGRNYYILYSILKRQGSITEINSRIAWREKLLKFRRITIRGAQPSARLSKEICLSEGSAGVSPRALRRLSESSAGSLRGFWGSAGFSEGFRG